MTYFFAIFLKLPLAEIKIGNLLHAVYFRKAQPKAKSKPHVSNHRSADTVAESKHVSERLY